VSEGSDRSAPPTVPAVHAVDLREHAVAARLIVTCFVDYPTWVWVQPDPDRRAEAVRRFYDADLAETLAVGASEAVGAEADLQALAVWLPSEHLAAGFAVDPKIVGAWGPAADRFAHVLGVMEAAAPREPHWYLDLLATAGSHRRRGFGGALVRSGLRRAALAARGAYLETAHPRTVDWYRALGFTVVNHQVLPAPHGPPLELWGLWHPPSSGGNPLLTRPCGL